MRRSCSPQPWGIRDSRRLRRGPARLVSLVGHRRTGDCSGAVRADRYPGALLPRMVGNAGVLRDVDNRPGRTAAGPGVHVAAGPRRGAHRRAQPRPPRQGPGLYSAGQFLPATPPAPASAGLRCCRSRISSSSGSTGCITEELSPRPGRGWPRPLRRARSRVTSARCSARGTDTEPVRAARCVRPRPDRGRSRDVPTHRWWVP
ncbi:MAG: hypothetical protein JWN06_3622 [Propionibacteriaceae bacterium]|nr:hypothetical protein [Propionibacteriaceae bacterium]